MPRTLVLLRHGQSTANADDTFAGWLDVPLTERGRWEARNAGKLLAGHGLLPDVVHTSLLHRAIDTAELVLSALGRENCPVRRSRRLNERHYGLLQGRSRKAVRAEFGDEAYRLWRRSYDVAPPPGEPATPGGPRTEALSDVRARVAPYWAGRLAPDVRAGRVTLVVAHGNSLRALCMLLDGLGPDEVSRLNVPTGVPLRYDFDDELEPVPRGGTYLDPDLAAAGVAEVLAQGGGR
ncbi:2,3-bisphosphoglycerate-dependent phosphoglycerate mutase [Amycolatopsis acidiphila]|uniref:2,3-bisphosphoglycerate-dependent phosphoglycerate mutase n=1 Tax=Amycolatopsis acidiphila TaxID=715473 RepID=A0A558AF93_9PSEU|nr:2,3-bisphosphoglycerate-dependent phosphoglycerate mutase [Amycolatopsis acidiphila]TVT22931.1 2,3-bisphosphoglycerate-dependent phosphoglycerate mutase [Amycolatopsis acidiphila]UIJ57091.1 2,3-bisphosphoglycerate-dependent phosphoglycerate mutase [Amycolatopsis acidiphila]GHG53407.1 2,3-bisphosphoglycerate-dependent phosphoglycerate mutase [Amycolatopsis acidiphila]